MLLPEGVLPRGNYAKREAETIGEYMALIQQNISRRVYDANDPPRNKFPGKARETLD
jgi:hypothetical protein